MLPSQKFELKLQQVYGRRARAPQTSRPEQPESPAKEPFKFPPLRRTGTLPDTPVTILKSGSEEEDFFYAFQFQREGMEYRVQFRNPFTGAEDIKFHIMSPPSKSGPIDDRTMLMGRSEAEFAINTISRELTTGQMMDHYRTIENLRAAMPKDNVAYFMTLFNKFSKGSFLKKEYSDFAQKISEPFTDSCDLKFLHEIRHDPQYPYKSPDRIFIKIGVSP